VAPLFIHSKARIAPRPANRDGQPASPSLPFGLPAPEPRTEQLPAGISLCMIVKNEERFLEACLRSVAEHVDEVCIVDTGSTDRTVEIATAFGARVAHRTWRDDFAWARNEALGLATKRWIFVLDADEELDAASRDVLRSLRAVPAGLCGLWIRCNNLSDDYKGSGASSHALVRFFPNNRRIRYASPVHEFISLDGKPTGLDARSSPLSITHHGYLSEIVKLRKKSERNLALVKSATENNPQEPFNWYNLGTTSLLCGDPDAAIDALERMRTIVGVARRGFMPNALAQLAELYCGREDYERAIDIANESLRKAPHFANAHFTLGKALAKQKRGVEARAAFESAIADAAYAGSQFILDDEISAWKAHSEIGSSFGEEGDHLAALEWFDRALQNRPLVIALQINRARALEQLKRYEEAGATFRSLADTEQGDTYKVDYVNYLLRRNDFAAAQATIDHVFPAVTARTQAALLATAAKLAGHLGVGDAEALLERAVAAHPGAAEALEALEAVYASRADAAGIQRLHRAELTAPMTLPPDYARRGTRFLSVGQVADAEAVTRAGLEIAASDAALRYNLGAVFVQTGRKEAALDELARAGTDGDIGLRAGFLRAIVLGDLGRYAEAIAAIDVVIAAAPNEIDARLQRFRFADALGSEGEAESTLRRALDLGDARVAVELATWLLRKGRFGDAKAVAERALQSA
jgi:tetratricopeptide (TPR) repeat protein